MSARTHTIRQILQNDPEHGWWSALSELIDLVSEQQQRIENLERKQQQPRSGFAHAE